MDRTLATSQSQGLNKMEQLRELVLDKNRVKQSLGSANLRARPEKWKGETVRSLDESNILEKWKTVMLHHEMYDFIIGP